MAVTIELPTIPTQLPTIYLMCLGTYRKLFTSKVNVGHFYFETIFIQL